MATRSPKSKSKVEQPVVVVEQSEDFVGPLAPAPAPKLDREDKAIRRTDLDNGIVILDF